MTFVGRSATCVPFITVLIQRVSWIRPWSIIQKLTTGFMASSRGLRQTHSYRLEPFRHSCHSVVSTTKITGFEVLSSIYLQPITAHGGTCRCGPRTWRCKWIPCAYYQRNVAARGTRFHYDCMLFSLRPLAFSNTRAQLTRTVFIVDVRIYKTRNTRSRSTIHLGRLWPKGRNIVATRLSQG